MDRDNITSHAAAVYLTFGFLDVWGKLPVNFFLKDDLHWSPSQVRACSACCCNLAPKLCYANSRLFLRSWSTGAA
jgi:hypothetical protein